MRELQKNAPLSGQFFEKRRERYRARGFGLINSGSNIRTKNDIRVEIDRIVRERLPRERS